MTSKSTYSFPLLAAVFFLLCIACNPAKKLREGEYLLDKNFIVDKDTKIDKNEIENYIKQKPNRRILVLFRFHLWLYNLANEEKVKRKRIAYNKKIERKNTKRLAKGKKAKRSDKQLMGEWLLEIGEAPVKLDTLLTEKSTKQIKLFLNNKGFFINSVTDSIHYKKRKKAVVYYKIKAAEPYTINNVNYKISDELLKYFVDLDTAGTLLKKRSNYDVDVLQDERDRVTDALNNNGYYLFTRDFIYYEIDTTIGSKKVNVTMGIKNFVKRVNSFSDSTLETSHQRFHINNIFIQPDFISKKFEQQKKDTLIVDGYTILHTSALKYKTRVLLNAIFIRKGELYQLKNVEDSYKKLSELKAFKTINIFFVEKDDKTLDCFIQLSPILKQSFTVETEGTHRSGNLGISGSFSFQNRNLFKGAEVFELQLKGGIEAQRTYNDNANNNINTSNLSQSLKQFNTIEFGPELNIYIPRFLVPFKVNPEKQTSPKTIFTSALNYQRRPDYERNILNFSYGYTWKTSNRIRHTFNPVVINFVKVKLEKNFETYLRDKVQNAFIINSFSNHLTPSTMYSFVFNEQDVKKQINFSYFKVNAESSGNLLRGFYDLVNSIEEDTFIKDSLDRYTIQDIAYSQYLRLDVDYRYYYSSSEINKVVFRVAAGLGRPLTNFKVLPFERSFFSGGSNGIRAWQARTLGPGSYSDSTSFLWNFGDGQLEGNVEYRLKLFKIINGALFIDAGNIWLRQPDAKRPGGEFKLNRFYKEIAIGSGVGIRADFNFFIIRFDIGLKLRDPQFEENKRWVIQHAFDQTWKKQYSITHKKDYNFLAFNIGIGYPF
ncbi:MAG: BamA/TamA family outer membrane protein [Bacteroidia bacterium]